jgi:hypothetical protein
VGGEVKPLVKRIERNEAPWYVVDAADAYKLEAIVRAADEAIEWTVCLVHPDRCCVVEGCHCIACEHVRAYDTARRKLDE